MKSLDYGIVSFYDSIYGVLSRVCDFLWKKQELYPLFRERLFKICMDSHKIGWGFGDMVYETVINLKFNLEDEGVEFGESEESEGSEKSDGSGETWESGK